MVKDLVNHYGKLDLFYSMSKAVVTNNDASLHFPFAWDLKIGSIEINLISPGTRGHHCKTNHPPMSLRQSAHSFLN